MQKLMLLFLAIFIQIKIAVATEEWVEITPMPHCPDFKLEYKHTDEYTIRFFATPAARKAKKYMYFKKKLEDINNLSELTNSLSVIAAKFCPNTYEVTMGENRITCEKPVPEDLFGQSYADLLKTIILSKNKGRTECEDVIPLIELQKEISGLRSENLIKFDRSRNFLKLFVGKESDKLIDHFKDCGGKKGSKDFIRNLVIIESKNACLFPSPPGLLSFEKTLEIANQIADEHPNMTLLKLNSEQDNIVRNAILKFVDAIFTDQIKSLLGEDYDAKSIIEQLDSVKKLKDEKPKLLMEHVQYILPLNATLEIVDVGLPLIIKENFGDILPDTISQAEKDEFLNNTLIPAVVSDYNKCVESMKDTISYPSNMSSKHLIAKRKGLEKMFCQNNVDECRREDCSSIKNLLTKRKDITDLSMIQTCVFKSFITALHPTLRQIVKGQKETLEQYIDFNEETIEEVTRSAYITLSTCADKKVKQIAGVYYKEPIDKNIEALYHITSAQYIDIIEDCGSKTEEQQVKDFIAIIIDSIGLVRENYGTGKTKKVLGVEVDEGSYEFSQKIIQNTIPKCMEIQNFWVNKYTKLVPTSLNCVPLIEMEAAKEIINKTVDITLKKYKINPKELTLAEDFGKCVDKAKDEVHSALFNPNHEHKILNSEQANNYLKENHHFYNCVQDTILKITDIAGSAVLKDAEEQVADKLTDPAYFKKLIPKIKSKLSSCFDKKFRELGNWPAFLEFNNQDGLTKLENECSELAIEYALPEIIDNELENQLDELVETKLISRSEVLRIQAGLNKSIAANMDVDIDKIKDNKDLMRQAYINYRDTHPNSKDVLGDFVDEFSLLAEPTIINEIGDLLLTDVVALAKPKYDLGLLQKYLTPQCVADYYMQNKDEIEKLVNMFGEVENEDDDDLDLRDTFVQVIMRGGIRAKKQNRYTEMLYNIEQICKNPDKYKDLKQLIATGIGDDFILGQMEEIIHDKLQDQVDQQCFDAINPEKPGDLKVPYLPEEKQDFNMDKPPYDELSKLLNPESQALICTGDLISEANVERIKLSLYTYIIDPKARSMIDLILYRRYHNQKLIKDSFTDEDFVDKTFYKNKDLINFIYKNFGKVITEDQKANDELNNLVVDQLFGDTSEGSFSEKFIEGQLIYSIGSSIYDRVNGEVRDYADNIKLDIFNSKTYQEYVFKKRIQNNADKSFGNIWKYENIKEYLAFEYVDKKEKQNLLNEVVKLAVKPQQNSNTTKIQDMENESKLNDYVEEYMNKIDCIPNPDYDPTKPEYTVKYVVPPTPAGIVVKPQKYKVKDNPKYLTLEEKITYDATEEITKNVEKEVMRDIKSGINKTKKTLKNGFKLYIRTSPMTLPIRFF